MEKDYGKTLRACYLAFVTQAIASNFPPLLFLKFYSDYGIPLGQVALIPTTFFLTQLVMDLLCTKFVDRVGYRKCLVAASICFAVGLSGLALLPELLPNPFAGILLSVVIYAVGSGLQEVLGSPIVEACPFEHKEAAMSLLHSFYCWGSAGTIVVSTVFFAIFGIENWKWLACIWALLPLYNIYNCATCPIETLVEDGKGMGIRGLMRVPVFWMAIILMVCAGASELAMAQWASAYVESAVGLSKAAGDLAGPCLFAITMGTSRAFYGKYGDRVNLMGFMMGSGILCLICYLMAAVSPNPLIGLAGCILCGFSVGIMWPGAISISSRQMPTGGTAMFALLAMAGDLGGALGPSLVGNLTQRAGNDLRVGMRAGVAFPLILIFALLVIWHLQKKQDALRGQTL